MAYQKINWANGEAGNTPLNANNLNKMDNALDDFESRIGDAEYQIGTLETTVAGHTTAISEKMDKNNPTGSGTLEIMKVKTSALVAKNGNLYLPNAARYTANDTETFPKIADKFDSVDASISSHSDSIWHLNTSVAQLNNNKLDKSGEVKISGGLEIESSTGIIGEEPSTSYINGFMLQIPQAEFSEDISVLTDSNDAVVNVGSVINTMKSDIQELKDNVGFEITSASPLNGCSASSIVGIDACGNSTQSGTPTPTNPIAIVDASGDVIAIGKNLLDLTKGRIPNPSKVVLSNGKITYTNDNYSGFWIAPKMASGTQYTLSFDLSITSGGAFVGGGGISSHTYTTSGHQTITFTYDGTEIAFCGNSASSSGYFNNLQIELGTTATSYVAYASNKITLPTLRSVGNVKDELIVNSDGSGQIIKRIGVKDLSTLTWAYNSSSRVFVCADDISALATSGITMMCNKYKGAENVSSASDAYNRGNYTICGFSNTSNNRLYIRNDDCTTVEQLNATFTNCVFRYALKTPTTTTLTASEVSAIRQLQTYSGTTIIDSALEVKSVSYNADTKAYIDSKTDYSYTDQIIGKWADGKPLHRMVIETTTPSTADTTTNIFSTINGNDCDVKMVVGMLAVGKVKIPINYGNSSSAYTKTFVNDNGINMSVSSGYASKPCEIIVEYTLKNESAISVLSDDTEV